MILSLIFISSFALPVGISCFIVNILSGYVCQIRFFLNEYKGKQNLANGVHCEMYFLQRQRYFNENATKILHCARLLLILQAKLDLE